MKEDNLQGQIASPDQQVVEKAKKPRGRPKGSKDKLPRIRAPQMREIEGKDGKHPAKVQAEFYKKFVNSGRMSVVLEKMFQAAMDDEHKLQGLAWSELLKRGLPVSYFEDSKEGSKPIVNINITGSDQEVEIKGES